tara:strand:- start:121 stop:285 length:165 start_codon:yes stop_codon:yes gene_type:complete
MSKAKIESLNQQIRQIGFELAKAQTMNLRAKDYLPKKIAHDLLLSELYAIEKKV